MRTRAALFTLALASLASFAQAQLGALVAGPMDVNTPAGNPDAIGVQARVQGASIEYHVTARGAPPMVYVFSPAGVLISQYPQWLGAPSATGWCDGASDGAAFMWGSDLGIHVVDTLGQPTYVIQTANGSRALAANPIPGPPSLACCRALAYDPGGDGGDGSFWVADGSSDLIEIDADGAVLQTWPYNNQWSIHGLALDDWSGARRLWASSSPSQGDLVEIDPSTGAETGTRIAREPQPGSDPGGLCMVVLADPYYCVSTPPFLPHKFLVTLNLGSVDLLCGYRLHRDHLTNYAAQAQLRGLSERTPSTTPVNSNRAYTFSDGWWLRWNFWDASSGYANTGRPSLVVSNVNIGSACSMFYPPFPEFTLCVVNTATSFPLFFPPNVIGAPDFTIPIPPGVFSSGDTIVCQGMYVSIPGPIGPCTGLWAPGMTATNTITFTYV